MEQYQKPKQGNQGQEIDIKGNKNIVRAGSTITALLKQNDLSDSK